MRVPGRALRPQVRRRLRCDTGQGLPTCPSQARGDTRPQVGLSEAAGGLGKALKLLQGVFLFGLFGGFGFVF